MARTQAPDYEARREAMLDIAAELYARSGFLGTSIAELADAWKISKSLLYHYFPSKEEILFEVMAGHMRALREMASEADAEKNPKLRLHRLTGGFLRLYAGASAKHKVLVNDLDKLPAQRQSRIRSDQRALIDVVRVTLREIHPASAGDAAHINALTMLYFGMINWTHTWYDPKGPVSPSDLAEMAVRLVLEGSESSLNVRPDGGH